MKPTIPNTMMSESRRNWRLQTLVRLRWVAVAGQTATIFYVAFGLGFPMPLYPVFALIAALALGNLLLVLRYPPTQRISPSIAVTLIGFDILQLSALLFLTGGLANPFAPLICVPVIISFTALPLKYASALMALAILAVSALALTPFPLPWHPGIVLAIEPVLKLGIWIAIISMLSFAAFYAHRVSLEAQQITDALAATELVLQREQHLSQLDGLAAAAAHELGTPLATISVVAKEMAQTLSEDPAYGEDVQLLLSQSQRCRDILGRLTSLSKQDEAHMRRLPLSSLVEEVVAPHRPFINDLSISFDARSETEPVGTRNPAILYGLGNLIENAVEHAETRVSVTVRYGENLVEIIIEDDGEGYAPEILPRIGEPFVSDRNRDQMRERAGGLGLGLFIAKTLLERSGAFVRFENTGGARITVSWPRWRMETPFEAGSRPS
ncbi:ActS/PrrB/RegB family redox-sensitive histidine kinase [Martelella mediterranea]|uniref:histidine kinase n=1 Tax=Martelella mediterranea TaxID=293089 RepID=A0A4R3P5C5_9HYPH|nr:ActS/PrrB/RegB family redox-sensitive histidine kinase [Martelella mediterranea]TCT44722.1 two-component system sensor histidine kinase RegB [Martelella mediterranea]